MSSLPLDANILTITYADDIAFFASASSLHLLYTLTQQYIDTIVAWTTSAHLSLKVQKCAVLLFPPVGFRGVVPSFNLLIGNDRIDQPESLKYLGVWYDHRMDWGRHIDHISRRASAALGCIQRCSSVRVGMRRNALLYVYRCYVRPILEYGCALFSHLPDYRISKLLVLERKALRMCLGLPRYTANDALYLEAGVLPLKARFHLLTVSTFLSLAQSPLASHHIESFRDLGSWTSRRWRRSNIPQLLFAQSLLSPLNVSLAHVPQPVVPPAPASVQVLSIFHSDAKHAPLTYLKAELDTHMSQFPNHLVIATDASVSEERAGVGIVIPQLDLHSPVRLPDHTPVFHSEFLAMLLALMRVPIAFKMVLLLSDSLSVISSLESPTSPLLATLVAFAPSHISHLLVTWIPGHRGLPLNEAADTLANMALSGPILDVLPPIADIVRARYRRFLSLARRRPPRPGYEHLLFRWNPEHCGCREFETSVTRARCLSLPLNFYLHRAGLESAPACPHCGQAETVHHFFLDCPSYATIRRRLLVPPLLSIGAQLSLTSLLSLGASHNGVRDSAVLHSIMSFISSSNRF
ncbi:uncharacterized protein LOC135392530 [Ornithodoros turicata]|uniref:uncharacterized protein LOC135392530 n=1 Tax=Ornithodoros turicata TaxID=34597 RepID=UPI003138BA68